jgi:anion transporter
MNNKTLKCAVPILVTLVLFILPVPDGLSANAWLFVSIFCGVVAGLILEPVPGAFIAVIGVVVSAILKVGPKPDASGLVSAVAARNWALSGFSNSVAWLVLIAFLFAFGYAKTGLGRRIGLILVKRLGKSTLGLGYAIFFADAVLAPVMPSNTARSGGTIFPIFANIPPMFGCTPENERKKLGAFLAWVALAGTCATSSMFMTGMATNLLFVGMASSAGYLSITWNQWFLGFLPMSVIFLLTVPLLTYLIYPPALKRSADAPQWAQRELDKLGPLSTAEKKMIIIALLAIIFWAGGSYFKIDATVTGFAALCLMLLTGIATWEEILANKNGWNAFIWFGALVTMAQGLANCGFLTWSAKTAASLLGHENPFMLMIILICMFYGLHYFFASVAAHVTALLPIFLSTAAAIPGINMQHYVLIMAMSIGCMGVLTPYGAGPSPVWASCGYVKPAEFWGLGLLFGAFFLAVILLVGLPWLRIIM